MADEWTLESRADGEEAWTQRSSHQDIRAAGEFNAAVSLEGWKAPSRWIRLSMAKGHLDPWNFVSFFWPAIFRGLGKG